MKSVLKAAVAAVAVFVSAAQDALAESVSIEPSGTYLFAMKDGQELYLDVYDPAEGSEVCFDGKRKPTVVFVFGGGFKEGTRNKPYQTRWFKMMAESGYRVVAIDYRLGLAGVTKVGVAQVRLIENAIHIAEEDLYSATSFLIDNAQMLDIDPDNIVISGSSAGAITVLQADYELNNGMERARMLPEGFRYAGVMAFSGAVFSRKGAVRYAREPAPTLLFHGTLDKVVKYTQFWFFNLRLAGASVLGRSFSKGGYNYNIYRFKERSHEVAASMEQLFDEEIRFLETNVMKGQRRIIDALVEDPSLPESKWIGVSARNLYKED